MPDDRLFTVSLPAERRGRGSDFVEVCPQRLGEIFGGRLDVGRTEALREALGAARSLVGLERFAGRGA